MWFTFFLKPSTIVKISTFFAVLNKFLIAKISFNVVLIKTFGFEQFYRIG